MLTKFAKRLVEGNLSPVDGVIGTERYLTKGDGLGMVKVELALDVAQSIRGLNFGRCSDSGKRRRE